MRSAPYDEHRAGCVSEHLFRDTAHEEPLYPCPSMAPHYDYVAREFFCKVGDHLVGLALSYERLDSHTLRFRFFPDLIDKAFGPVDQPVDCLRGLGLEFFGHIDDREGLDIAAVG